MFFVGTACPLCGHELGQPVESQHGMKRDYYTGRLEKSDRIARRVWECAGGCRVEASAPITQRAPKPK